MPKCKYEKRNGYSKERIWNRNSKKNPFRCIVRAKKLPALTCWKRISNQKSKQALKTMLHILKDLWIMAFCFLLLLFR